MPQPYSNRCPECNRLISIKDSQGSGLCPKCEPKQRDPDALKSGSWNDGSAFFGEGDFFSDKFGAIKKKFGYEE